jgi:hypothetical protein
MHTVRSLIKRHLLMTFVALAYLLSWWPMPLAGMLLPAGPMLAALIVVGLVDGRAGLKELYGRVVRRSGGLGWYALAAALPGALALAAAGLNILLGAPAVAKLRQLQLAPAIDAGRLGESSSVDRLGVIVSLRWGGGEAAHHQSAYCDGRVSLQTFPTTSPNLMDSSA